MESKVEMFANRSELNKQKESFLIFSRTIWESETLKQSGFNFSKEELDLAEKLNVKLIGIRKGVKCYLQNLFT